MANIPFGRTVRGRSPDDWPLQSFVTRQNAILPIVIRTDDTTRAPSVPSILRLSDHVPCLTVLWHHDPTRVGERCVLNPFLSGTAVALSRHEPRFAQPREGRARSLDHSSLSRQPFYLRPTPNGGVQLDPASSSTSVQVIRRRVVEPLGAAAFLDRDSIDQGVILVLGNRIVLLLHTIGLDVPEAGESELIGESPAMTELRRAIRKAAGHSGPVLIRGETGTGKELVARAVHRTSGRSDGPWVAINLGALSPDLAAAELFGSERGAFTGAERRDGYFRRADGGTLFLDEIGATPDSAQAALLRALDLGEIQPVGAKQELRVNTRVVAATDADLEAMVEAGRFRGPLLYRLMGHSIDIPPLRERKDDIGRLLVHFLREELSPAEHFRLEAPADADARPWLSTAWIEKLVTWPWPGNVRELRAVARRLAEAGTGREEVPLSPQLEYLFKSPEPTEPESAAEPEAPRAIHEAPDEQALFEALRTAKWSVRAAARLLGLSPAALYRRIDASPRLHKASDLTAEAIEAAWKRHDGHREKVAAELNVSSRALLFRLKELGWDRFGGKGRA